jgi:hypothetical protein
MTAVDRYAWEIALRDSGVGDSYFLVAMLTLRTRLDADGYAWPSMELWARDSRMSVRKLRDVVAQAVEAGWLEVVNAGRSGQGWKRHGYYIHTPSYAANRTTPADNVRHAVHHLPAETCGTPSTRCGTPRPNVRHPVPTNQDINQDNNQDSVFGLEIHQNLPRAEWDAYVNQRKDAGLTCDVSTLQADLNYLASYDDSTQIAILNDAMSTPSLAVRSPREIKIAAPKKSRIANLATCEKVDVPGLDRRAWSLWVEYRMDGKHPFTVKTAPVAAQEMAALGDYQMAAVQHSIAGGYQNVFMPKRETSGVYKRKRKFVC